MKVKFADPESITFMKKTMALAWLKKKHDYVFDDYEDHLIKCKTKRFDMVIDDANDVYFWFTVTCPKCAWKISGTVVHWRKGKWVVYQSHQKPTPKERKGQLLFEGC